MMQNSNSPFMLVVGTRPEGIKIAPVYYAFKQAGLPVVLCATMQHQELLADVFDLFDIVPDITLSIMKPGQDLFYITQVLLQKMKEVLSTIKPVMVLVHGDTTTAMVSALASFYLKIPVGHLEAGLRTHDIMVPFPEECNRRIISLIAHYHYAPTSIAVAHLQASGIEQKNIIYTGNTVADALRIMQKNIKDNVVLLDSHVSHKIVTCKKNQQKIILFTMHRREIALDVKVAILHELKKFLQDHPDVFCFYPYHPNRESVQALELVSLASLSNAYISKSYRYHDLVYILSNTDCVVTDSGGLQEEALIILKPVIVMREKTERTEGLNTGLLHIVGTDEKKVIEKLQELLSVNVCYDPSTVYLYGDGYAAEKIVEHVQTIKFVLKNVQL